ncbi:MAG: hypothetical protein ACO4BJ_03925 [Planctomycetota bacterium]|jgi:hypothetical protein
MSPTDTPGARRRRERERSRLDDALFRHLGDIHELSSEERALLGAIASERGFPRRSDIFVRPSVIAESPDHDRWPVSQVRRVARLLSTGESGRTEP